MTSLLDEIRGISEEAASKLEKARYTDNADICTLNRQDLLELLPGDDKLRLRKKVYEVICSSSTHQYPIDDILKGLKNCIPPDSVQDALASNYLPKLNDINIQLKHVQGFIDAHIDFLESIINRPAAKPNDVNDTPAPTTAQASMNPGKRTFNKIWRNSQPPERRVTVTYKMRVCGNTLGRHMDVLKNVNGPVPTLEPVSLDLQETQNNEESQVTFVFCPIVSRVGTDVQAALTENTDNKPVILVAMHHIHTPRSLPVPGPYSSVELGVNVFFHETVNGLLKCAQNYEAINAIKMQLLEHSTKKKRSSRLSSR